jgi:hypothetical protein
LALFYFLPLVLIQHPDPRDIVQHFRRARTKHVDIEWCKTKKAWHATIAYTALAYGMGCSFATGDSFAAIHDYIRTGAGNSPSRVFVNEHYLEACQQGPHQHAVIVAGRYDQRRVDAIVNLFGRYAFSLCCRIIMKARISLTN